jgi:hypothetical protein
MADHAKLSPSSATRWINCPGSISLSEGVDAPTSIYALEGSVAHFVGEMSLKNGDADPAVLNGSSIIGTTVPAISPDVVITEEMVKAVKQYTDYVRSLCALGANDMQIEIPVKLDEDVWGTLDCCVAFYNDVLHIIDYKHGAGVAVEVANNTQLMIYAIGALMFYRQHNIHFHRVRLTLVQPRARHIEGSIRSTDMGVQFLYDWYNETLVPAVAKTRSSKELNSGDWCRFCPVLGGCPQMTRTGLEAAQQDFKPAAAGNNPQLLSPAELARILDLSPIIKSWLADVAVYAQSLVEAGGDLPGYKLVNKKSNRQWINEKEAREWLRTLLGDDVWQERKMKSVAQIEEIIKAAGYDVALLDGFYIKPDTGYTLVSEADRRTAVEVNPLSGLNAQNDYSKFL